ncbi:MAG: glycosyltransferase, partial [Patescibacteria group bacterium]|nr:glycosyltransferase [Patescibacteria group bacterium]
FVNPDDRGQFTGQWYVRTKKTAVISGMGVDLVRYGHHPSVEKVAPSFFMAARLLKAKGVREYADAARIVRVKCPNANFRLAGGLDANPSSVGQPELDQWRREGALEYLGQLQDVRPAYADCSVFILPSYYREGTPQVNLEAMATGRPIITTDAPGCRETVLLAEENAFERQAGDATPPQGVMSRQAMHEWARTRGLKIGVNGILVPPKNVEALVAAMKFFIDNPEQIDVMGRASRRYAEDRYDVHKVNAAMLEAMEL